MLGTDEKPDVRYEDVGGLDAQKQEIREAVELPLTQVGGATMIQAKRRAQFPLPCTV